MTLIQDVKARFSFAYGVAFLVALNGFLLFLPVLQRGVAHSNAAGGNFNTWKEALSFLALLEIPGFAGMTSCAYGPRIAAPYRLYPSPCTIMSP